MKHRASYYNKRHKRNVLVVAFAVSCVATLSLSAVTLSKYVSQKEDSKIATPVNFSFESNYLKANGAKYTVYTPSVDIELKNNDGINTTTEDLIYSVNIINGDGQLTNNNTAMLIGGGINNLEKHSLSANSGNVVTVSAISSSPYSKTLSATFEFKDAGEETVYKISDKGYFLVLDIYTGANIGDITIDYGTNLAADNTNTYMSGDIWKDDDGKGTLTLVPNGYYSFVFFENNPITHSEQQNILQGNIINLQ